MSGVEVLPLGEVVKPIRPRVKPSEYPNLPFIGMEHVEAHSMKLLGTGSAAAMKSSAVHFKPGDVLYGRLRPYLNKVHRPTFEGLCSAEFIVFPENERVDGGYLQYFLNSSAFVRYASHLNTGDRPRVDFDQLAPYRIPLPEVDEQRRIIAEIEKQFSRLDEAVANLKRVKANLKRYKAAVLNAAVEGRLVPTEAELARHDGRNYETGEQLRERVLRERRKEWSGKGGYREPGAPVEGWLGKLPDGWATTSLEAVTSASRVICYGILMPKENVTDGVLYVKVRDMKNDVIDLAALHRTSREIAASYARASLRPGDLLLSIRGTYGRVATVPQALDGGNITQDTARLDISGLLNAEFVALYLRSETAQRYFKAVARGVAVKGVNIGDLRPMAVALPPLAEQDRIVAEVARRLSILDEAETEVEANQRRAQSLRAATLVRAFSMEAQS